MKRIGDLEIDEDIAFQRREWMVQRVCWVAMLVIVVLALLGLFGTGPISSATAGDEGGPLAVEYERFLRHQGQAQVTLTVAPDQVVDGQIQVWIAADYLSAMDITQVSPEPTEVQTQGDRLIYIFTASEPTLPVEVAFSLQPDAMGRLSGKAGIVGGAEVSFRQFIYP